MTTLAIVGGGIVGKALLYNLTREKNSYEEIFLFESDPFAFPCSLHSTAVVALRGVTEGHSPLGDQILRGFDFFSSHVKDTSPQGVFSIRQYTGALTKLGQFRLRHPQRGVCEYLNPAVEVAVEEAFLVDPRLYLEWLWKESSSLPVRRLQEFVTELTPGKRVRLKTQQGNSFEADQVVFAGGHANRHWRSLVPGTKAQAAKASQGTYLEFSQVGGKGPSFSLTLEGKNLVYHAHTDKLLMGSTTHEHSHSLAPLGELRSIHRFLQENVTLELPEFEKGEVRVGHREKASRRMPYVVEHGNLFFIGGMYKNGYTLSAEMTRNLCRRLLSSF